MVQLIEAVDSSDVLYKTTKEIKSIRKVAQKLHRLLFHQHHSLDLGRARRQTEAREFPTRPDLEKRTRTLAEVRETRRALTGVRKEERMRRMGLCRRVESLREIARPKR